MSKITKAAREKIADARYASIAKSFGMENSLRALWEGRAVGLSPSLILAVLEQESGGRNVFGHDPVKGFPNAWKGSKVTKAKYLEYRKNRRKGTWGMQGVGPMQLTWWEFQDGADKLGGAWVSKYNIRYGMQRLSALMKQHGHDYGIQRYNGSGPFSERYMRAVLAREKTWHKRLTAR